MHDTLATLTLPVAGMTCDHCVGTVRRALESVPGVESASVDLRAGQADVRIDPDRVDESRLRSAVEAAGYRVATAPPAPPTVVSIGLSPALAPVPAPAPAPAPAPTSPEEWD